MRIMMLCAGWGGASAMRAGVAKLHRMGRRLQLYHLRVIRIMTRNQKPGLTEVSLLFPELLIKLIKP
eukprot:COSAG01_NODE_363_length_18113_cov_45.041690_17_plen_67_part_00